MCLYEQYHLKVFSSNDVAKGIISQLLGDNSEGLLLILQSRRRGHCNYLFLAKPEKIETVERILRSKLVLLKRKDSIRFCSSGVFISDFYASPDLTKFLIDIDTIRLPEDEIDKPVIMPYGRLEGDEYLIGQMPYTIYEEGAANVAVLVSKEADLNRVWQKMKRERFLSFVINTLSDTKKEERGNFKKLEEEVMFRCKPLQFLVEKVYEEVVLKYKIKVTKKDLASALNRLQGNVN